jgi:hypothetical protein
LRATIYPAFRDSVSALRSNGADWHDARPEAGITGRGELLFARYAYAPNELGYCGPRESQCLFSVGMTGSGATAAPTEIDAAAGADIATVARSFSGAWPYLAILADQAGIADPLDERVVRAYWTGGPLLNQIDRAAFGRALLAAIGGQAGHYWTHLTPALLDEVSATHGFHVFGVYPWSRMLSKGSSNQPLLVLDNCRIRWGRMLSRHGDHVTVRSRRLIWDGRRLSLAAAKREEVRLALDGQGFVTDPQPGEWLALHWDWVSDRLRPADVTRLRYWTNWQLSVTNRRLSAGD